MPFKDKKKRATYMRRYRQQEKHRKNALETAIRNGQFDVAKQILDGTPTVDLFGTQQQKKRGKK